MEQAKSTRLRAVRKKLFLSMSCLAPSNPDFTITLDKMMRADLDAWSSFWFWILVASTIMVAIGIICEAPEIWQTVGLGRKTVEHIRKFWYIRLRRVDLNGWERLCPELITKNRHDRKWIAKIGFIGWAFVALGVAGEGVSEYFVNDAETNIRAFDETLLADAQRRTGLASERAAGAFERAAQTEREVSQENERAAIAEQQAQQENERAAKALESAETARKEAEGFQLQIAQANERAASAEQRAKESELELARIRAPRSLTNIPELVAALTPFKGTEYTLNVFMDDESIQFTKIVARALDAAGWMRKQPAGINIGIPTMEIDFDQGATQNVPACIDTGISLRAHAKESLTVLQSSPIQSLPKTVRAALALNSAIALSIFPPDKRNVTSGVLDPKPAEGIPITICVGKKP